MLAVSTTDSLVLIDSPTLKRAPATVSATCSLSSPTASAWSPDNACFFVAHADAIHMYDPSGSSLGSVYQISTPISALVSKDRGSTLIFSAANDISVLETYSGKISQTFSSHKSPIRSLSLSNDATLLASTSLNAVHVHNLSLCSHTVLRGLPMGIGEITQAAFHPHSRTRLLLACGMQLAIYDTTRPSRPAKVIPLDKDKGNSGQIVAIACSPFSKTLVAVACSGGSISLIDLDKEKGLFRTLPLRVPLTSFVFSPEGAALYAGTENGKVFMLDLRALDKPPKIITVSKNGQCIVCMSVQRKLKAGEGPTKPLVQQDVNKAAAQRAGSSAPNAADKAGSIVKDKPLAAMSPVRTRVLSNATSPARPRTASASIGTPRPTRSRTISTSSAATSPSSRMTRSKTVAGTEKDQVSVSPVARKVSSMRGASDAKKAFSPPKSPLPPNGSDRDLDVSVRMETLLSLSKTKKENMGPPDSKVPPPSDTCATTSRVSIARQNARTRAPSTTSQHSSSSRLASGSSISALSSISTSGRSRQPSTTSAPTSVTGSCISRDASPIPPMPALPPAFRGDEEQLTAIRLLSRTPSPNLPPPDFEQMTPLPPAKKKGKGKANEMDVLGLGTPEVERWIDAGEGKGNEKKEGKRVGFVEEKDERLLEPGAMDKQDRHKSTGSRNEDEEAQIEMTVRISPRRPLPNSTSWAPVPSPLRGPQATSGQPPPTNPAQDLLHTLIRDALYDFRRETKAEIIGLHLDLVKMGRGWRKEMREAMDQWNAELHEVREENRKLREENERLRRGY